MPFEAPKEAKPETLKMNRLELFQAKLSVNQPNN